MALKAYALTTAQRVADYGKLGTLDAGDVTKIEALINVITDYIEKQTGKRFKKTTYTNEEYDTERAQTINLKHFPVLTSEPIILERRSSDLNENDWEEIDSEYYHVDAESGMIEAAGSIEFARTRKGYRVTYTAGYDFDNTATFLSDTEAGDIELAAWILCLGLYESTEDDADVKSERIGDYSITYQDVSRELLKDPDAKAILDQYIEIDEISVITPSQT